MNSIDIRNYIRDIVNFPKEGIVFKDITPLLGNPSALAMSIEMMANPFRELNIDIVAGAESRGFIFGTALAQSLSAGFVPIRKPNKLPHDTHSADYDLEYGSDSLQIHIDAIQPNQRVLIADDLLATGGTMQACCELVERMGCELVGLTFLIELEFLKGREKLAAYEDRIHSLIKY